SAEAIVAKYHLADQLQLTFRRIKSVFDPEAGLHLHLELKQIRFLRPGSSEEVGRAGRMLARSAPGNLLDLPSVANESAPSEEAQVQHVRDVNLEYAARLPSFVADETARRYTGRIGSSEWRYFDTIDAEIAVQGTRVARQKSRRNGKPYEGQPPGFRPNTGFGAELKPLFDPACPTRIQFERREALGGKPLLVYGYSSPPDGCFSFLAVGGNRYNAARIGRAWVSETGGNLLRFEEEAAGFPADFGFDYRKQIVSWDRVKIGDATHLVPVAADFVWLASNGELWHVEIQYRNHRRFEASSSVTFR
ncbi:MAG TPA: hypothetical protein VKE70_31195, partial [Candidatus Solibacter sp.]|nr:hypothetical protein [Candidatus Solibacter sp.]